MDEDDWPNRLLVGVDVAPAARQLPLRRGHGDPDPFNTENCGEAALDQLVEHIGGLLEIDAFFVTARELPAIIRAGQAGWTAMAL